MGDVTIVRNEFADDDRSTNGCIVTENYAKWIKAMDFANTLAQRGKILTAEFEDGNKPLVWHGCLFTIPDNVDFNAEEVVTLTQLLECFEGLTVIVDNGVISCSGITHIYKAN